MEPQIRSLIDISQTPAAYQAQADLLLERAHWAATLFGRLDLDSTRRITGAVADAAHAGARHFAELAVNETGFGIVADKTRKNELTAHPIIEYYRDQDFVNPRLDHARRLVEIPRPAGVIFALTPSTNPIATLNYKILLAMMTRNAIIISPHPAARTCSIEAAHALSAAAVRAGAPDGAIQIIEHPSIPLVEAVMRAPRTRLILATGGNPMVRAAYGSSNPAIGVGAGNAPAFVDSSADIEQAAKQIVESKHFDNSTLCTNESVIITVPEVAERLQRALKTAGAHFCDAEEVQALRRFLFHDRGFNVEALGRDATWIAAEAGIKVSPRTRILVAPIRQIGVEEPLSREKLCPVAGFLVAGNRAQAMRQARGMLRLAGAGHSAAIHARDAEAILRYGAEVEAYRIVVNAPCSQGAAGFATQLAPTFTVGTGYFGRSSIGENVGPQHLVHWTRVALGNDDRQSLEAFEGIHLDLPGALRPAPADGVPNAARQDERFRPGGQQRRQDTTGPAPPPSAVGAGLDHASREELRRIIAEELRALLKR